MPHIRIIAAAAACAVAFAFAISPASSKPCDDGEAGCVRGAAQAGPMKLDHFMSTWKPASVPKRAKKAKTVKHKPAEQPANAEPVTAETPPPAAPANNVAAAPAPETDGVAIASFDEVNELDAAAGKVQVVAFNEINELDLTAPAPRVAAETTGQSVSPAAPEADHSWIGKLLLAAAGTIAIAGGTRMLIAA